MTVGMLRVRRLHPGIAVMKDVAVETFGETIPAAAADWLLHRESLLEVGVQEHT
jgi:hypothetical protein